MYIISKRKDYYDGAVGLGIDKSIVYERKIEIEEDSEKFIQPFTSTKGWDRKKRNGFRKIVNTPATVDKSVFSSSSAFIVGFCGKLYIGWKFYHEVNNTSFNKYTGSMYGLDSNLKTFITYDLDFIKKELVEHSWSGKLINDIDYILNYKPIDIFRKLNTPIFIHDTDYGRTTIHRYRNNEVFITNPTLKEFEFYKVMDSYTAFQEIQMFMGGVLGSGEKEIVEVEDKYKITQHGFDNNSFRRSKANGKKRPQSNR